MKRLRKAPPARRAALLLPPRLAATQLAEALFERFPAERKGIGEVLDLLGLRDLADRNVRGLSGGAQQRVPPQCWKSKNWGSTFSTRPRYAT